MIDVINKVKEYAAKRDIKIYMVGGAVRDKMLKRDASDLDFACTAFCHELALDTADYLKGSYVNMHQDVARVVLGDYILDFANLKGETIEQDIKKRDFTINSIAIDMETRDVIDTLGGQSDLRDGIIRHSYDEVFNDDPLRMIRAVRLSSQLGFKICDETIKLIKEKAELLEYIPGERITDEIYKILESSESSRYITILDDMGLLKMVFPIMETMKNIGKCKYHTVDAYTHSLLALKTLEEGIDEVYKWKWGREIKEHLYEDVNGRPRIYTLKLGMFLHDVGKPAALKVVDGNVTFRGHDSLGEHEFSRMSRRLSMSLKQREIISSIIKGHMRILGLFKSGVTNKALYRLYRNFRDNIVDILLCSLFDLTATRKLLEDNGDTETYRSFIMYIVDRYYESIKNDKILVTGRDVIEMTSERGKRIGEILDRVDEEVFCGNIKTREEALELVKTLGSTN